MKKLSITLFAAIALVACKQEPTSYTISGTIAVPEAEGKHVFLTYTENDSVRRDSTIITDGQYQFIGSVEKPVAGRIMVTIEERSPANNNRGRWVSTQLIVENGKIKVETDDADKTRLSGTVHNNLLQKLTDAENIPGEKRNAAWQEIADGREAGTLTPEREKELREIGDEHNTEMRMITLEFVKENINNIAGWSQLGRIAGLPVEQLKEAVANATEQTLQKPEVDRIVTRIDALEKTAIGQPFTDLRMPNLNGNEIAISDFAGKGKYVLIDFTATWCGPCRVGKPAMIATYNKYKNKGFEIVSVYFDNTHEAWANGVKALNTPNWPKMSDLKGWQSDGAKLYAVSGIPHSVLIDRDGIIIAKDLRGEDLEQKLAELFN
jgi:thiol-disulfide isomerase/thioredoxin